MLPPKDSAKPSHTTKEESHHYHGTRVALGDSYGNIMLWDDQNDATSRWLQDHTGNICSLGHMTNNY